jgi:hypothetical protein
VVAAVSAFGAMAVDVLSSHAGAESPVFVNELLQWLHIAAAGVWIGGLAVLLMAIRGLPSAEKATGVRRFSLVAGFTLLVLVASGTIRAVLEVTTFNALFTTAFGQLVIIKVALVVVLMGLGAVNRWRNVPAAPTRLRGLRVVGSTELIAATAALLVAAALVNVSPPVEAASTRTAQQQPLVLTGSDAATTVKVRLSVSPGTPGFNTFALTVTDYDTGAPVTPTAVKLTFSSIDTPTVGDSTLELRSTGRGAFSGQGANLSLNGRWRVAILLEQGAASTEVDLQATLTSPPPKVDVQHFGGGLPTLYTVHLTEGRTVQIYFDPDHSGATQFHATYFDSNGKELPIGSITVTVGPAGTTPTTLAPQRLDAGHFVADVTLPSGSSHFTVVASTSTGEQLATAVNITPGS